MSGVVDFNVLLQTMQPALHEKEYVFCTVKEMTWEQLSDVKPWGLVCEEEGVTLIVEESAAQQRGWDYDGVFCCITLCVHSSLEAVGLTAAVASALAECEISANVVAAYYHDHIFVPSHRAKDAMVSLKRLCHPEG
ncbi:MAG: ACT domain-containing protein [Spartobacteria bacterium]|nr:ACT domain-containing protein [Spartobacteria bacterium]